MGLSLGISISFPATTIPALFSRAIAIAKKLADLKYDWTHSILKTMICKFQALREKLSELSDSECFPKNALKFRLIFGGSVSAVGFTPLWEVDFPLFEDAEGTPEGALCKMQKCVKNFFTGLKNKLLGGLSKSVANIAEAEGATGFCEAPAPALLETSTSVKGGSRASAGLGFKFLSSPAATVSLICTTNENPITECGSMYAAFAKKAASFVTSMKVKGFSGAQDLKTLQSDRRPMGLPVANAPANDNQCKKKAIFRLAIGAEVALGIGVEFSPADTCFGSLCAAVKVQMGNMAPKEMTCAGGEGLVMGTNNPFLKLEKEGDWEKAVGDICKPKEPKA
jgi:hypothetical protein